MPYSPCSDFDTKKLIQLSWRVERTPSSASFHQRRPNSPLATRRLHKSAPELEVGGYGLPGVLGMPLHTHAEALVLHLDGLGNAVGCHGHEAHAVAEPIDATMMARVDLHLARPIEDTGEQLAVLDRDRVRGIVQDREMTPVDLALWHR